MSPRLAPATAAVTPVVGVVLLLVIVVALGGAFLLTSKSFTDEAAQDPPEVAIARDPAEDSIRIVRLAQGLDWGEDLLVSGCSPTLNGEPFPTVAEPAKPGDTLACSPGSTLVIRTSVALGNTVVHRETFA